MQRAEQVRARSIMQAAVPQRRRRCRRLRRRCLCKAGRGRRPSSLLRRSPPPSRCGTRRFRSAEWNRLDVQAGTDTLTRVRQTCTFSTTSGPSGLAVVPGCLPRTRLQDKAFVCQRKARMQSARTERTLKLSSRALTALREVRLGE